MPFTAVESVVLNSEYRGIDVLSENRSSNSNEDKHTVLFPALRNLYVRGLSKKENVEDLSAEWAALNSILSWRDEIGFPITELTLLRGEKGPHSESINRDYDSDSFSDAVSVVDGDLDTPERDEHKDEAVDKPKRNEHEDMEYKLSIYRCDMDGLSDSANYVDDVIDTREWEWAEDEDMRLPCLYFNPLRLTFVPLYKDDQLY